MKPYSIAGCEYPPSAYAHNRVYTRASQRPDLPYMGTIEDGLVAAFYDHYAAAAHEIRTPQFQHHMIGMSGADSFTALIASKINGPGWSGPALFARHLTPVVAFAAGQELQRHSAPEPFTKAPLPGPVQRHVDAANHLALNLISRVNRSQLVKIRAAIVESISRGVTVQATAQRISNLIGLFPRWQTAVDNYYQKLLSDGQDPTVAAKLAAKYHDTLLRARARMIARTEIMRALVAGRQAGWEDMAERGVLNGNLSKKRWLAAPDACPECDDMDGQTVTGINTPFRDAFGGEIDGPPLHPNCRCTVNLIRK